MADHGEGAKRRLATDLFNDTPAPPAGLGTG